MKRAVFAVPGDLSIPTGGYVYDRRITEEMKGLGWTIDILDLGEGFPDPSGATRSNAEAQLAAAPKDCPLVVDGLALGVLPEAASRLSASHRMVALIHHPLAFETGLAEARRASLHESERRALGHVKAVVVTSAATKELLVAQYGVVSGAISVVRPANDRVAPAQGNEKTAALLAVGSITPRKGYDVLIVALAMLKDLPWTLTIAGDRERNRDAASRLDSDILHHGLAARVSVVGAVPDAQLAKLYAGADLFVLASHFEGYGMALADATAYGLPVVGTKAGAIPEAVPADASILVPPDDPAALAGALRELIEDKAKRRKLADNARRAALHLPTWRDQAIRFAGAIGAFA